MRHLLVNLAVAYAAWSCNAGHAEVDAALHALKHAVEHHVN